MRIAVVALIVGALSLAAKSPVDPVNKNGQGVAIKGYDPVAYFREGKPVKGISQYAHPFQGATFWFSSAENRDLFTQSPDKYAPQYGGYCSWAVSQGYTADIDPEAWRIVDGKLYLNYSKSVQQRWEQNIPQRIQDADRNWPSLHK